MNKKLILLALLALPGCGGRNQTAPPVPAATRAPILIGETVMIFPVQGGSVPVADTSARHFTISQQKLDAELAYWLPELANSVRWVMPTQIKRAITRSPTLEIDIGNLAVGAFQRAEVKRIGDPLFGDLRKLSAVLNARIAVIPVAAEQIGRTPETSRVQVATAVIDALSGNVLWFGVIEGDAEARGEEAGVASAAQAFARAFAPKRN
jgi:hypothetical protein